MKKNIILIVLSLSFISCNNDEIRNRAKACFNYVPDTNIVTGDTVQFLNCSENSTYFTWDFGDGEKSTYYEPKHSYHIAGVYYVKLIASEISTIDSISKIVNIKSDFRDKYEGSYLYNIHHKDWEITRGYYIDTNYIVNGFVRKIGEEYDSLIEINYGTDTFFRTTDSGTGVTRIMSENSLWKLSSNGTLSFPESEYFGPNKVLYGKFINIDTLELHIKIGMQGFAYINDIKAYKQ